MWQEGWQEAATTGVIRKKWNRKGKNPMIPGCPRKGLGAENLCGVPNLLYSLGLQKTAHILLIFLEIKLYVKKWQMHTNQSQVLEFYSPLNIGCRLMILIKNNEKLLTHRYNKRSSFTYHQASPVFCPNKSQSRKPE